MRTRSGAKYGAGHAGQMLVVERRAVDISVGDVHKSSDGLDFFIIFNPDKKRSQAELPCSSAVYIAVENALRRRNHLRHGRTVTSMVVLHSEAGCQQQPYHTDHDTRSVMDMRDAGNCPSGCLVAVEDNTVLELHGRESIMMQQGDMVVFDGDICHAGAAYTQANIRIHAYIESPGHTGPPASSRNSFPCMCAV